MPIRRLKDKIGASNDHDRTEDATARPDSGYRAAHELLRRSSVHLTLYDYIRDHPDCLRSEACAFVLCNHRRVTDLIDEGLVYVSRREGNTGRLRIVEGGGVGPRRDLLKVQLRVFINQWGEYSVDVKLMGEKPGSRDGKRLLVAEQDVPLRVPRPQEKFHQRVVIDASADNVIDVEATEVTIEPPAS